MINTDENFDDIINKVTEYPIIIVIFLFIIGMQFNWDLLTAISGIILAWAAYVNYKKFERGDIKI